VETPKGIGKHTYQHLMCNFKLDGIWNTEHDKTFMEIKKRLVSELVLQAPWFDGTHFILTTDGSKDAFAGVLSQCITSVLPGGQKVMQLHPLGYASK
jgi:RNase H-like domain found in reverse transcriptase